MTNEMTRTAYPIVNIIALGFLVLLKFRSPLTVGVQGAGVEVILTLAGYTPDLLSEWPTIQLTSDTVFSAVAKPDFTL